MLRTTQISLKTPEEQQKLRIAGALAADVLDMIGDHVKPGISTDELDQICNDYIVKVQKTVPANVGYRGFPKTVCTSVNHVVCHGIPNDRKLKNGDILNVDVAIIKDGYHGDTSRMYFVGKPAPFAQRLVQVCKDAMWRAIELVRPGAHLGDIGHAIQSAARSRRILRGARVLRPRHRARVPRGSADTALRGIRYRTGDAARHGVYDRTDDQFRQAPCARAGRQLDGGDQRPLFVGTMGAHGLVTPTGHEVLTLSPRDAPGKSLGKTRVAVSDPTSDTAPDSALDDIAQPDPAPLDWPLLTRLPVLLAESRCEGNSCRALLAQAQEELRVRFFEEEPVEGLVRARARFIDVLLATLWHQRLPPELADTLALVAVGGYGRGELHPHSDVDLLVLVPAPLAEGQRASVEQLCPFCGISGWKSATAFAPLPSAQKRVPPTSG